MAATVAGGLRPVDLSAQEGVYYHGRVPGGETVTMWSYSHRTDPKNEAPLYWFEDCLQPCERPLMVPFTASQVSELLLRV